MGLRIVDRWFEREKVDDDITLLWEPYTDPLIRCNIWHVRGRDRDLLVDTGLGIVSLRDAAHDLFQKSITAVATHTHYDHTGSMHEFESLQGFLEHVSLVMDTDQAAGGDRVSLMTLHAAKGLEFEVLQVRDQGRHRLSGDHC